LAEDGELYVFAQSDDRVSKERAMRRRQLKWLWKRLRQIDTMEISREELLMKLGGARSKAPAAWRLVDVEIDKERPSFTFALNRKKLRTARRREGRYLLRTNLIENDPAQLWQYYTQLVAVEEAFRNLKGDLAIRPVFHQDEKRIEAHIFIAFLAYCMQITLTRRLHALAPGLTARRALEKFAAVQMIDVHLPTTDGREISLTRYTHPEPELQLLIDRLKLRLPPQPPPPWQLPQRWYWLQSAFEVCRAFAPSGAVAASMRQSRHLLRQTAHARLRRRPRSTKLLQSRFPKQVLEYACPSPAI